MSSPIELPEEMLAEIYRHAEADYPNECCGMVFAKKDAPDSLTRVRRCNNVQDKYHEIDPETFPRTAKTAYFIDPRELLAIDKELLENGEIISVIYHSHPDVEAYFSEEDTRRALIENEPMYPDVDYLVVSVINGTVQNQKLFAWDGGQRRFVE